MFIGYSTGSIAKNDFRLALQILAKEPIEAIEVSALREHEIYPLFDVIDELDLSRYNYVSFHAPSKLTNISEDELIGQLTKLLQKNWPIVVHPDIIQDYSKWRALGHHVCIENMDKRKPCGRTADDLEFIFQQLPAATFCLDVAHARQVDPTMSQCYQMLMNFSNRLTQVHLSDVTSDSKHVPLNIQAMHAYERIIRHIPGGIPVILESPIFPGPHQQERVSREIQIASELFSEQEIQM
jgi:hypothetical protein